MKKSLQILFGLVLILVLAYVAFLDVSAKIKDDLLRKTKVIFSENNINDVTVNTQGEGLSLSRSLVLVGTAISEVERIRIVTLTTNIEGVCHVDNQIKLYPVVPKAVEVPVAPEVPTVIKIPVLKAEPAMPKQIHKEIVTIEKKIESKPTITVEKKIVETSKPLESSVEMTTKVPAVPVVPTPVKAINAPEVIKIEKIKLEGVK